MRSSAMGLSERDEARFWAKVALPDGNGCMLWLAYVDPHGYGSFGVAGTTRRAHRVSYIIAYGPIPDGLVVDHVKANGCTNKHCVAPLHLEAVTQGENIKRGAIGGNNFRQGGLTTGALSRAKTHCPKGHAYDEANTYVAPLGDRRCRACAETHRTTHRVRAANATPDGACAPCPGEG